MAGKTRARRPHNRQSSREYDATPSSGTSPLASYKEAPPPHPPGVSGLRVRPSNFVHWKKTYRRKIRLNYTFLTYFKPGNTHYSTMIWSQKQRNKTTKYSHLLVTRTLFNSNLPLTRSNFHSLQNIFRTIYTILPSITQTPDISNFFLFPLKVWIIGSRLYMYQCCTINVIWVYPTPSSL